MKTIIVAILLTATAPTYAADSHWRTVKPSTASAEQINENLRTALAMCKPVIFSDHPENIFACMRDAGFVIDN
jgi:hypothetical protein